MKKSNTILPSAQQSLICDLNRQERSRRKQTQCHEASSTDSLEFTMAALDAAIAIAEETARLLEDAELSLRHSSQQ